MRSVESRPQPSARRDRPAGRRLRRTFVSLQPLPLLLCLLGAASSAEAAYIFKDPDHDELLAKSQEIHYFVFQVRWQKDEKAIRVLLARDCKPEETSFEVVREEGDKWYADVTRPETDGTFGISTSLLDENTSYCLVYQVPGGNKQRLGTGTRKPFKIAFSEDVPRTRPLGNVVFERATRPESRSGASQPLEKRVKWRVKMGTVFIHVRDKRGRDHDEKGTGIVVNKWGHVATMSHLLLDKHVDSIEVKYFPRAWVEPGAARTVTYHPEEVEFFSPGHLMLREVDGWIPSDTGRLALLRPKDWSAVPHGEGSFPWHLRIAKNTVYLDSQQHLWIVGVTQEQSGREPVWQAAWTNPEITEKTPIAQLGTYSAGEWEQYPRYVCRQSAPGFSGAPVIDAKGRVWAINMGEVPELYGSPHVGTWAVDIVTFFDELERDGKLEQFQPGT